ncbi:oxidoreductase [Roseomonas sp. HF4]|uniref:oxidoreductase n=1 Tax=Roseomonas sp. HF4 TaxID=2562313 RepID=UPI001484D801|nr:oxidoreductase [Roseomonas sp. HF4]
MTFARRAVLAAIALPGGAHAAGEPVLEVAGAVASPAPHRLARSAVEALGQKNLVTITTWTRGPQHFAGVPLERLLGAVGARGRVLRAVALNDYAVTMPLREALDAEPFVATRQDGNPMPVRSRGPFWIVFPWSCRPDLDTARVRQWSVWQLARIEAG